MSTLQIVRNSDGTISIRKGGFVETFDPQSDSPDELYDRLRWLTITTGVRLTDEYLTRLVFRDEWNA